MIYKEWETGGAWPWAWPWAWQGSGLPGMRKSAYGPNQPGSEHYCANYKETLRIQGISVERAGLGALPYPVVRRGREYYCFLKNQL